MENYLSPNIQNFNVRHSIGLEKRQKFACTLGFPSLQVGNGAHKNLLLLQSLLWEWMPVVPCHKEDKSHMLVVVSVFLSSVKS